MCQRPITSVEATAGRMRTGEPVQIDLANNAFTLTLHTASVDISGDGIQLDHLYPHGNHGGNQLSNRRLSLRDPSAGLQTNMPLPNKTMVPAETYVRYVSM